MRTLLFTAALAALTVVSAPIASAQQPAHDPGAAPPSPGAKTADQVFKNIVQLKGAPADQLIPAMQFISASLGVECDFCHVPGKMDLDDKPHKKTAREMMAMMMEINKANFGGHLEVTCNTCHHGSTHPAGTPPVLDSDAAPHAAPAPPPPAGTPAAAPAAAQPAVDDVITRYVEALGGSDAIKKATSRVEKGSIVAGGTESPIELTLKAPNKRISASQMPQGQSYTAFDGTAGWMGATGRPAREMSPAESAAAGIDAEFYLALRLKEIFPQLRVGRPEEIAGTPCVTLIGSGPNRPPVRLYFDSKSGLLVRVVRFAETPLGRNPTQIDYADYREADGVKIPFRWTLARPNGRFTIQIASVQTNVTVDDAKFAKPDGPVK
jgi:photosynthetic reaction center cytochrome c subunit